ncbi:MAG: glycosyltransferase [Coleofasciculus sp. G1-WW12-02]|uniref:glycosyltransferase family 2 protein n=1 Tax=Coleofasciculus sp. G1-WW12-02 TaxID=3068483 RepID=UPI0032F6E5B3
MESKLPSVTIVLATYNRASSLSQYSLPAITKLTYSNYEVIVIDDASTDDTHNVFKTYETQMTNLRILSNHQNRGACFSRNLGVAHAKGEIIVFIDDDVSPLPDCLNKIVKVYIEDKEVAAAWGCVLEKSHLTDQYSKKFGNGSLWSVRRKVFDDLRFDTNLQYFRTSACDEHELARRIQKCGFKIVRATEAQAYHFLAPAENRKWRGIGGDLNYLYEKLKSGSIIEYYIDLIAAFSLSLIISLIKNEAKNAKTSRKYKYKQLLHTPTRILIFIKEREFSLALKWLFYVVIDIPIRAKTKGVIEYLSKTYSKKWPA